MAAIKGMDAKTARRRIEELLVVVNLVDAAKRPLGGYSGGMKQRVGIAQALLNDPQLLIVDEPTVGLDPAEPVRFRNLLSDLAGARIIILSTHIGSDVEATATDIVISWLTAILFIPSLALALGTLTGSGKAFEALLVLWMYGLLEQVPVIDFAGLVPGSHFYLYAPGAIGLMAIAALARRRQLQAA